MAPDPKKPYDYSLDHQDPDRLFAHETVNGTEMVLRWDDFRGYTLYFPAMDLKSHPMDEDEEILSISHDSEHAQAVLDFAVNLAMAESNVHELYRKSGAYARSLDPATEPIQPKASKSVKDKIIQALRSKNSGAN